MDQQLLDISRLEAVGNYTYEYIFLKYTENISDQGFVRA